MRKETDPRPTPEQEQSIKILMDCLVRMNLHPWTRYTQRRGHMVGVNEYKFYPESMRMPVQFRVRRDGGVSATPTVPSRIIESLQRMSTLEINWKAPKTR